MPFNLNADWPRFIAGLILLLVPLPLFLGKAVEYRDLDRIGGRYLRAAFALVWHWLDLARALAGTWLLAESLSLLGPNAAPLTKVTFLALLAILAVSVVVQTVTCKHPESFHTSFPSVAALVVILLPPAFAALVLAGAITLAAAFRSAGTFFLTLPAIAVLLGNWLFPNWLVLGVIVVPTVLPFLLPLLFGRELVIAHRAMPREKY